MSNINWGKLKSQDRVNDIGKPWTPTELTALHKYKIPAAYVRGGILEVGEYKKELKREKKRGKSLEMLSNDELANYAVRLGVNVIEAMSIAAIRFEVKKVMDENDLETFFDVKEYEQKQIEAAKPIVEDEEDEDDEDDEDDENADDVDETKDEDNDDEETEEDKDKDEETKDENEETKDENEETKDEDEEEEKETAEEDKDDEEEKKKARKARKAKRARKKKENKSKKKKEK